jgi:predicted DNA-binding transcriptional regulator AlpA
MSSHSRKNHHPPTEPTESTRPEASILESLSSIGFLREKQLLKIVSFSHTTLWSKVNDGTFPAPVKLSERITAWRVEDVRAWAAKR